MAIYIYSEDRCVMCGRIVPEGRMVCPMCEKDAEARTAQMQAMQSRKSFPALPALRKRRQSPTGRNEIIIPCKCPASEAYLPGLIISPGYMLFTTE